MAQCKFLVPQASIPVKNPDTESDIEYVTKTVPKHRCEETATVLCRSLKEVQIPKIHGTSLEIVADEYYCDRHKVAGTITYLNGQVATHAFMGMEA